MTSSHRVAPSHQELRPFRSAERKGFPVYPALVEQLRGAAPGAVSDVARHVLAVCATYSYSDTGTLATLLSRMGLESNSCLQISERVDAMFIDSTAFLTRSQCGRVALLSFRGTPPLNFINWLTDADVDPETVSFDFGGSTGSYRVHGGFYRNVRATRFAVLTALQAAITGKPVAQDAPTPEHPLEALYVTGHSLGGAMAALFAAMLVTDPEFHSVAERLRGVYTYGQPMVGNPAWAEACAKDPVLGQRVFRYVYAHDVVPALPPRASGPFAHFGSEFQWARPAAGKPISHGWVRRRAIRQMRSLFGLPWSFLSFLARQLKAFRRVPFVYSLEDHGPQHYVSALTPPDVVSEFGN
jgi:hypothetical protein